MKGKIILTVIALVLLIIPEPFLDGPALAILAYVWLGES